MNNVYIGSRYVPKFYSNSIDPSSTDWEAGVDYEPLTVVTHGSNSYTSKRYVPDTVGAPSINPDYWAKTGDYNAAIASMQNEINDIKNDIGNDSILTDNNDINSVLYAVNNMAANALPISKTLKFNTPAYAYYRTLANVLDPSDETYARLQGCGYDSTRDRFFIGVVGSTTPITDGCLAIVSNDFQSVITRVTYSDSTLGHCNSICYDPVADIIAILTGNTRVETFRASTLYHLASYTLVYDTSDTDDLITQLAYDTDEQVYYGISVNGVYSIDNNFIITEHRAWSTGSKWTDLFTFPSTATHVHNGVGYKDGKIYLIHQLTSSASRQNYVATYDKNLNVISVKQLDPISNRCEVESVVPTPDDIYIFGAFMEFVVYTLQNKPHTDIMSIETFFNGGVLADAYADANVDFFPTGVYTITSDRVNTVSNIPVRSEMTIISVPLKGRQVQIAVIAAGSHTALYNRTYDQTNRAWGTWGQYDKTTQYLVPSDSPYSFSNSFGVGFITGTGKIRLYLEGFAFWGSTQAGQSSGTFTGYVTLPGGTNLDLSGGTSNLSFTGGGGRGIVIQLDDTSGYSADAQKCVTYHGAFTITAGSGS